MSFPLRRDQGVPRSAIILRFYGKPIEDLKKITICVLDEYCIRPTSCVFPVNCLWKQFASTVALTRAFITFESAASYRLVLDGERLEYGTPLVNGLKLKELAGVDPETYALWLEVRGGEDEPIANDQVVDLSQTGLARFFTVIEETTAGQPAVLPSGDREYLISHSYRFDEITEGNQRGVVIKDHGLPNPNLSAGHADVLILLPNGYPDVPPDMFYCLPWLKLAESDRYPERADNPFQFAGHSWQRWSRHNQEWRPGKDGIWTMLRRVDRALAEAG